MVSTTVLRLPRRSATVVMMEVALIRTSIRPFATRPVAVNILCGTPSLPSRCTPLMLQQAAVVVPRMHLLSVSCVPSNRMSLSRSPLVVYVGLMQLENTLFLVKRRKALLANTLLAQLFLPPAPLAMAKSPLVTPKPPTEWSIGAVRLPIEVVVPPLPSPPVPMVLIPGLVPLAELRAPPPPPSSPVPVVPAPGAVSLAELKAPCPPASPPEPVPLIPGDVPLPVLSPVAVPPLPSPPMPVDVAPVPPDVPLAVLTAFPMRPPLKLLTTPCVPPVSLAVPPLLVLSPVPVIPPPNPLRPALELPAPPPVPELLMLSPGRPFLVAPPTPLTVVPTSLESRFYWLVKVPVVRLFTFEVLVRSTRVLCVLRRILPVCLTLFLAKPAPLFRPSTPLVVPRVSSVTLLKVRSAPAFPLSNWLSRLLPLPNI